MDGSNWVAVILALITIINGLGLFIIQGINKKMADLCLANRKEHDELFTARRDVEKAIEGIETIHRLKGCDAPVVH